MREFFPAKAVFQAKVIPGKEAEGNRYRDYFDWEEPAAKAPSHRILAMRRGEKEEFLTLRVVPPEAEAIALLDAMFVKGTGPAAGEVRLAVEDAYRRLLANAMETEIRLATKKRADAEAIRVFADNLRQLLLAPPLGQKRVLGLDPGFRTGCKVVCLDAQGKLLHNETIYPHLSEKAREQAAERVRILCPEFRIEAIAIGNGTAGRETETFLRTLGLPETIQVVMVNESGASVYSASKIAREEFPDHDVTVRGAVSIGRRLMDPLAELVKIDPKAIGVGQYQHDVDQTELKQSLDDVVMSCVNAVGVELNTASAALLTYVSGLGPALAGKIVAWRDEHGPFPSREALKEVPRLGAKAFVQAAGFLRIRNGENPLDASAVHPESYAIVDQMAADLNCSVADLMRDAELRKRIDPARYVTGGDRPPDPERHPRRAGQARTRSPRRVRGLPLRRRDREDRGPHARDEAPRDRDEHHRLRRLRGYRGPPGRPRPPEPDRRPFREGCRRRPEGPSDHRGDGSRRGPGAEADLAHAEEKSGGGRGGRTSARRRGNPHRATAGAAGIGRRTVPPGRG